MRNLPVLLSIMTLPIFLATMAMFASNSSQPQNPIVGKWESAASSPRTIEFCEDGTFRSGNSTGTYQFPDNAHIILVPPAGQMYASLKSIKIDGGILIFTDTDFRRAKPKMEKLRRIED